MLGFLFGALLVASFSVPECDPAKLHYRSSIEASDDFIRVVLVISPDRYPAPPCSLTFASDAQIKYDLFGPSTHWVGYLHDINGGPAKLIVDRPYTLVTVEEIPKGSAHGTYTLRTKILTTTPFEPPTTTRTI